MILKTFCQIFKKPDKSLIWISNFFGTEGNLAKEDLRSIQNFSLFWNAFESSLANRRFSINSFEQRISQRNLDINRYTPFLDYFRNRYTEHGSTNNRFRHLLFRPNDRQDLVRDVLLGSNQNHNEIILAVTIILYRYRNNLFHGEKDIRRIRYQKDNFNQANQLLMTLMEDLR